MATRNGRETDRQRIQRLEESMQQVNLAIASMLANQAMLLDRMERMKVELLNETQRLIANEFDKRKIGYV